jgi:hypothetical protein
MIFSKIPHLPGPFGIESKLGTPDGLSGSKFVTANTIGYSQIVALCLEKDKSTILLAF